jgi:nicotinate-nucleotide adenylyltransferase
MRLGIFGGSFNPVHYGHLLLAECCREQRALDQVLFLPAAIPPHKRQQEPVAGVQRLEMLELAIGGHEAFGVSSYEVDRGGVNYTVDTLAHLKEEDPSRELFFLMGADSLADLPNWREPERICSLATPLVVRRSADAEPDFGSLANIVSPERIVEIRSQQVEMPRVDLSSSDLRARVAAGQSIRYRTSRAVEKYIETHGLYRPACELS